MLAQVSDPIVMVVKQVGDVRIHTFVSSFEYSNIANATHIIETKNQLVLVDGQFLVPYARAFRDYADSLGKSRRTGKRREAITGNSVTSFRTG